MSEVMLQQTRVEVVAPRFLPFLARWPAPAAMAAAPVEDVLAAWSGLGYYGRARRLHAAARALVERHGGAFPRDVAALRALPGVGPYTAGAVGSLALGLPLPLVDGNVARVLARLFAVRGDPARGAAARRIRDLAAALVPARGAGPWNEGLMELGALVCVPRTPRCGECPLASRCAARAAGLEGLLPETAPRPAGRTVRIAAALVRDRAGRVLLLRRPEGGLLGGTWELPSVEVPAGADPRAALADHLSGRLGGAWAVGEARGAVRHAILDRRIRLEAFDATGPRAAAGSGDARHVAPADLAALPTSSLVAKTLRAADASRARGP